MQSLKQFFSYMNDIDFPYVVLRNFENLPHSVELGEHSDLDLLVYDFDHWKEIFPDAKPEFPYPRVRFKMPIGDNYIYIDVRHLGDGYYPEDLEKSILDTKEWNERGFFTPNPLHFRIGLAYHVVHHKGANNYQRHLGDASVDDLYQALKNSNIGWSEPKDPSVGKFNPYWKGATSVVTIQDGKVAKRQVNFSKYNLLENEARVLGKISSVHFPKVISKEKDQIILEDCGQPLTEKNLPENWKHQLVEIVEELKAQGVQHRDIKPDNLMVLNGIIKLIDFGWSRFVSDDQDEPPTCLGYPYKPSWGFDDSFSMRKVIKELEFKKEGVLCGY